MRELRLREAPQPAQVLEGHSGTDQAPTQVTWLQSPCSHRYTMLHGHFILGIACLCVYQEVYRNENSFYLLCPGALLLFV